VVVVIRDEDKLTLNAPRDAGACSRRGVSHRRSSAQQFDDGEAQFVAAKPARLGLPRRTVSLGRSLQNLLKHYVGLNADR